jgi:hypothetical protein
MKTEEFECLNTLAEKAIINTLTPTELNEFKRLLNLCNDNLQDSYAANATDWYFS